MSELALNGGNKTRNRPFFGWPHYDDNEIANVTTLIKSGKWFAGMRGADKGSATEKFEKKFAAFHGVNNAIACANGSVAIELALRAAGIGQGDEVIVPALTFIATLSAVLQVNAVPVLVDTRYDTQCIDPVQIERAITAKTRAIIPVHYGGFVCDMEKIMALAAKHKLVVIEDSAHAHGAVWKGKRVGSIGEIGTFSFQESKTMTAGEGGIITTKRPDLAEKCITLRSCGRHAGESWYVHYVLPLNYRLAEVLAAILLAQMDRLDSQLKKKAENAAYLKERFSVIEGINPVPGDGKTEVNGYYLYLLQYDSSRFSGVSRNTFIEALNAEGIPCHIGYPWPLNKNPMFKNITRETVGSNYTGEDLRKLESIKNLSFPVTERICNETVVIPHQVLLSEKEDMDDIVAAISKIRQHARDLI